MYKTSELSPGDLTKINIKNQSKIKELTGSELIPRQAWEVIKRESKGFTEDSPKAKQADELFAELMKVNGLKISSKQNGKQENQRKNQPTATKKSKEAVRLRMQFEEEERLRKLELIKLELELKAA